MSYGQTIRLTREIVLQKDKRRCRGEPQPSDAACIRTTITGPLSLQSILSTPAMPCISVPSSLMGEEEPPRQACIDAIDATCPCRVLDHPSLKCLPRDTRRFSALCQFRSKANEHCQIHVSSRLGTTDIAGAASRATRHQPYQGCEERPIIVSVGWSRVRVVACMASMT